MTNQSALQQIGSLPDRRPRRHKTVDFEQKGMLVKIRQVTHMEGAQLGQGFDPEPGRGYREVTGAGNSLRRDAGNGIKEQEIRPAGIDMQIQWFWHVASTLHGFPPARE